MLRLRIAGKTTLKFNILYVVGGGGGVSDLNFRLQELR